MADSAGMTPRAVVGIGFGTLSGRVVVVPGMCGVVEHGQVKAAVMCEDVSRTVHLARQLGAPKPIPPDQVDGLHHR